MTHLSAYFLPNVLLQWISFMPQLEGLAIAFHSLFPTVMWRDNSHIRHTLHFLTFASSGSEALALTWKRLFVGGIPHS